MGCEVYVLGTGGMMPLPNRHLTSVLLRREGDLFLFDCGEATQIALRKLNLKWKKIHSIFITHTHADHVTGLPGIIMLSSQVQRDEPLYIYGPARLKEFLETTIRSLEVYINYEIIIKEIPVESQRVVEFEQFYIRAFPLKHTKRCVGYSLIEHDRPGMFYPDRAKELQVPQGPLWSQLQKGESVESATGETIQPEQVLGPARKGIKFSFITDTMYFPEISPEVTGSDLLICEGMFTHDLIDHASEKRHLTAVQAATIAKHAGGVKQMGLIHYSPRYTDRELKMLLKEAQEVFPETFLTKERQHLSINYEE